ncbi:hypothetical protein KUTeg_007077 [Tegillarca granosa]|uniref:ubiquitinyl hydrolase 1 n=1 Tax=Tegillarca granosa TaxID=220873 RepID=A0ABQ9FEJ2_TEGGR|nr:hypothetical protein KUTeg_007077 [Tegillarca granosa]
MFNTIVPGLEEEFLAVEIEQNFQRFTSISIPVIERKLDDACLDMGDISPAVPVESSFGDNKQQPNQSRQGIFSIEEGNDSGYCVKQLLVFSPPPVLVIHINRFKQSQHSGQLVKIQDEVSYPLELNLSPFVKENDKNASSYQYSLYGIVCHDGPITGGHYYSLIRTTPDENLWCKVSDSNVQPIQSPLGNRGAYILMYQQIK